MDSNRYNQKHEEENNYDEIMEDSYSDNEELVDEEPIYEPEEESYSEQVIEEDVKSADCIKISKRTYKLFFILVMLSILIIFRVFSLQFLGEGKELREMAINTHYEDFPIDAKRGDIFTANGSVLTSSIIKYKVFMDLRVKQLKQEVFDKHYKALADSLSNMFKDASASVYEQRLLSWRKKNYGNKLISPSGVLVDYNELKRIRRFPILNGHPLNGGAKVEKVYKRTNYYGTLAQRTIGRVETKTARGYGIEKSFDEHLRGVNGNEYRRKVSGSFWMPVEGSDKNIEPMDGADIVTTIDANIQDVAEKSLRNSIEKYEALSGSAVVMEVSTGKICAMANLGRNRNGELIEDYNHAIASNVEPGSTFKLLSLIALLENTDVSIDSKVDTKKGVDVINGIRVSDSEKDGYGVISLKTSMSKSSNIGFARLVDDYFRDKPQEFIDAINKTGIAKPFDFQLEGARNPIIRSTKDKSWSKADLVTMSYGYATNFTALRILMLYNAIANNGTLITPYIVSEVKKGQTTIKEYKTDTLNSMICSKETLEEVKEALADVMFDGTVRDVFRGANYVVAGKTGTSRQVGDNGKYESDKGMYYLASFVGYFPAENPKYSCIVQIKTFKPRGITRFYYGSMLAAPVFKEISHHISARSDWGRSSRIYAAKKEKELAESIKLEQAKGKKGRRIMDYSDVSSVDYSKKPITVVGSNDDTQQLLTEFGIADYNIDYKGNTSTHDNGKMPNVVGMGLNDALTILEDMGLNVSIKGAGRVTKQSIKAGRSVKSGNEVSIILSTK